MTDFFQTLAATLDLYLPWLLPTLETIELAAPAPVRVVICGALIGLLALRHRQAAAGAGRSHLVAL